MMLKLLLLAAFVLCGHGLDTPEEDAGRVVGGVDAEQGAWPSQVSLQYYSNGRWYHFCGGTLVSQNWVITAAHCMGRSASLRAVVGEHNLFQNDGTEQYLRVNRKFIHPNWSGNDATAGYDIAVLRLSRKAFLSDYVKPIALPRVDEILPVNALCYITGWGLTSTNGQIADILQQARIPFVPYRTCSRSDYWGSLVKNTMVCAGGDGITSGCQGDSGGPLYCWVNNQWAVHGVTSFGSTLGCNVYKKPTVFTRVSAYTSWINEIMNSN